ncbi:DUF4087 domain-containing protein [Viridibacterium curvum]|uniref:DUF4087 domain-containing protein n=1 Tax=Viridibacterium curvum TaxID=1101404 RepID=A0ABP9QAV1_9RHOO
MSQIRCLACLACVAALLFCATTVAIAADKPVTRCGWFENPTPGNAWLKDADGEWVIGIQGGHQAEGDWPEFGKRQWVRTNAGSYGYGCACLRVVADPGTHQVSRILSGGARPLQQCKQDAKLRKPAP